MESIKPPSEQEQNLQNWKELGKTLLAMQEGMNNGMGISCVRQGADYLIYGQFEEAKRRADWDQGKIENYPDIRDFLLKHGLLTPVRIRVPEEPNRVDIEGIEAVPADEE